MEGMFIEEPTKKQGFNFNFSLPFFNSGFKGPVIQLRTWVEKLDKKEYIEAYTNLYASLFTLENLLEVVKYLDVL